MPDMRLELRGDLRIETRLRSGLQVTISAAITMPRAAFGFTAGKAKTALSRIIRSSLRLTVREESPTSRATVEYGFRGSPLRTRRTSQSDFERSILQGGNGTLAT